MDGSVVQTYLSDVLHAVSQALLAPDIILLLAFIAYALFCIGSIIAERFSERRHFKVAMPQFLADLMAAKEDEIPGVIERSGLLNRQKTALLTVYDYRILPGDALVALIKRLVNEEETRYDRIAGRNNMAARVSPMLGLMGTLIPLGPGIQALGKANTEILSNSLLVAFDTTVAGLVVAAVCLVVGKIRGNWYSNYMSALDSAMATMLQKIEDMREEGKIQVKEPSNYAFLFESTAGKSEKSRKGVQEEEHNPWKEIEEMPSREQLLTSSSSSAAATSATSASRAALQPSAATDASATHAPATMPSGMPIWRPSPSTSSSYPANTARDVAPATMETTPIGSYAPAETRPLSTAGTSAQSTAYQGYAYSDSAAGMGSSSVSQQTMGLDQDARLNASSIPTFDSALNDLIASPHSTSSASTQVSASATRVAPPVQEVPMPSFLDTLAASTSSGEPFSTASQAPMGSQGVSRPQSPQSTASQGWYQPPRSGSYSTAQANYNRDMPLWGTVQPARKEATSDKDER